VARTVDPLAGSYFVESLTDRVEAEARAYLREIGERGGAAEAVEYMQDQIHQAAYRFQREIETGDRVVVGVNRFTEDERPTSGVGPDYRVLERQQRAAIAALRERRSASAATSALEVLARAARGSENLMPVIMDAVRASVTLGEISETLRHEWGTYDARG
jgi:methylmalonyl-CoA mutase N-terminal domain/subunit